jgi:hypothetical protein
MILMSHHEHCVLQMDSYKGLGAILEAKEFTAIADEKITILVPENSAWPPATLIPSDMIQLVCRHVLSLFGYTVTVKHQLSHRQSGPYDTSLAPEIASE